MDGPGSRERETPSKNKGSCAPFLDFLFGMLTLDPTSRVGAKTSAVTLYITGEPDAKNPFKPPSCMETTSAQTRKNINGARGENGGCGFESARGYCGEEPKQTVQTPFPDFVPPPLSKQPVPCWHCCECSRCYCRGTSSSFG